MAHILKNKNLEIHIDFPHENYNFSRFDWTGKIVKVNFNDVPISTVESFNCENENYVGKGFYNEFGIDSALGFDDAQIGEWFHKIGVGLLKKDSHQYLFSKKYDIRPAEFKTITNSNSLIISCKPEAVNGFSYFLEKKIDLHESSFTITYYLQNTGEKSINTDEYIHNFTAINNDLIGSHYKLKFPFQLIPELFNEIVNPEQKIDISKNQIDFRGSINKEFFFSNLTGNEKVKSKWELLNHKNNIAISETTNFTTNKVNLWGSKHVVSPELFFNINIKPGESTEWSRTYNAYHLK